MNEERGTRGLYRNAVSLLGGLVCFGSLLLLIFALALDLSLRRPIPYIGIFTYMVFPAFFAIGVLIVLVGMWRESLRRRKAASEEALPYPRLDLNDERTRKKFSYIVFGAVFVFIVLTFVTYNAFLFTESVTFCGRLCHSVMAPELAAYEESPHSRVGCVQCHVGHGASFYVKSKLSGVRQVYSVVFKRYPTPIPTPIENLRPARETCEECHWPAKFYGTQLMQIPHFRYDERNTPEQISLGVKTGGGGEILGGNAGIHWHMLIENKINYVAIDRQKHEIPYIHVKRVDGTEEEYIDLESKGSRDKFVAMPKDQMDCMDCHNRPTHTFTPPDSAADKALASGHISRTLPWVKKVVVDALVREYPDREKAHDGISAEIVTFYKKSYPAVYSSRKADVEKAIATAISIYDRSVFPNMKVNWKTYPSNIGHRNWPGCFRCHDGRHVDRSGKPLSMECTTCHTMPQRGPLLPLGAMMPESKANWHPFDLKGKHARILCNKCHAAGYRPPTDCAECHKIGTAAPMMASMKCDECHKKPQEARPFTPCKECHDSVGGLHRKGEHPRSACTDCHKPHKWAVTGREICQECHSDMKEHHKEKKNCAECHKFKG